MVELSIFFIHQVLYIGVLQVTSKFIMVVHVKQLGIGLYKSKLSFGKYDNVRGNTSGNGQYNFSHVVNHKMR